MTGRGKGERSWKGGAKRHRKVLRDNIQVSPKPPSVGRAVTYTSTPRGDRHCHGRCLCSKRQGRTLYGFGVKISKTTTHQSKPNGSFKSHHNF
ncbi:Histone H4 [Orchesella cincta]|uniref:Histone H4 n=1 Tax=Orchesella cincta TaxID=48709 RepID=A0A1D2M2E0_ORCCI|nr:Histone H4 [Orchesella cincta]